MAVRGNFLQTDRKQLAQGACVCMISVNRPQVAVDSTGQQDEQYVKDGLPAGSEVKREAAPSTRSHKIGTIEMPVGFVNGPPTDRNRGDAMTSQEQPIPSSGNAAPTCRLDVAEPVTNNSPRVWSSSIWEQWFARASTEQRTQLLELAGQQGLIYSHQLPAVDKPAVSDSPVDLLRACLSGSIPFTASISDTGEALSVMDLALDDVQRQAVRCALTTPDLALILGYPGTGKSRVVSELLAQAITRGLRVLFVAQDMAGVDRALERLSDLYLDSVLRLGDSRPVDPRLQTCWLSEQVRRFHEDTLATAVQRTQQADSHLQQLRQQAEAWRALGECLTQLQLVAQSIQCDQNELACLDAQVEAAFSAADPELLCRHADWHQADLALSQSLQQLDQQYGQLQGQLEPLRAQLRQLSSQKEQLAERAAVRDAARWWTGAWWRAIGQGDPTSRLAQIDEQIRKTTADCEQLENKSQELLRERQTLQARRDEQRATVVAKEKQSRETVLTLRLQQQTHRAESLQQQIAHFKSQLSYCGELSIQTIADRQSWCHEQIQKATSEADECQRWLSALKQLAPRLTSDLLSQARIVAGTTTAVLAERQLNPVGPAEFDLLILEEAHRASEAELLELARRTRRWVLVGEPSPVLPISAPRKSSSERNRLASPSAFARLWNLLHADPRRLPVRWTNKNGRLLVSLHPVAVEHRNWLHHEPVFDRPDIELTILALPGQDPVIAEVLFPENTSVAEAKSFIFRELQELSIQANCPMPRWLIEESAIRLELSAPAEVVGVVELESGIREHVGRCTCELASETPWPTAALSFDRQFGWDLSAAQAWIEQRLGLRDLGRTVVLHRSYRATADLARTMSRLLHGGCYQSVLNGRYQWPGAKVAVEFLAVPRCDGPRSEPEPRWSGGGVATLVSRTRSTRGGAGLEVELSDPHRLDAIPVEWRSFLPAAGLVNALEARTTLSRLEALVGEPGLAEVVANWQSQAGKGCPAIAVVSTQPAQVELLRQLVRRSTVLQDSKWIQVCTPTELAQRECLILVLSLTRSHSTRAVPFSGHPSELLLALTRPASRLILLADPGTLIRRSQWFGGLDHQDELTGPIEQALISQLLTLLSGDMEVSSRSGRSRESNEA